MPYGKIRSSICGRIEDGNDIIGWMVNGKRFKRKGLRFKNVGNAPAVQKNCKL
jgi:hypothetical protein